MKVVRLRWFPRRWCINLFGVAFSGDTSWINDKVINHERIHTAQMRELLFVPFYVLYVAEWLVRLALCRGWMRAYRSISFEREAYGNDADFGYLGRRRAYAWMNYLLK
ncbi:MAG: hypothetical protein ACI4AH_01680 [Muribaculaceae bacterium]